MKVKVMTLKIRFYTKKSKVAYIRVPYETGTVQVLSSLASLVYVSLF